MDANRRPTALLIDDESASSGVQKARLEKRGYTVFVTADKSNALAQARRMSPNAIFVHLGASEGGSLPLLQALRSDDVCRHIPVVVIPSAGSDRSAGAKLKTVPRDAW